MSIDREESAAGTDGMQMDKARLKRLVGLRREITRTRQRIAAAENRLLQAADDAEAAALRALLADKRDALMDYLRAAEAEEALLIRYIEEIPDSDVRELFMLRYVDGVRSWQRIAFLAGEHDESYVRRKHDRYINKKRRNKEGKRAVCLPPYPSTLRKTGCCRARHTAPRGQAGSHDCRILRCCRPPCRGSGRHR